MYVCLRVCGRERASEREREREKIRDAHMRRCVCPHAGAFWDLELEGKSKQWWVCLKYK